MSADAARPRAPGTPAGHGRTRGFSLLEVLVALVVLGLLIGTLTQGVRFGVAAVAAQARVVGLRGDEDAVERALRRLVEQMDPGTFSTPPQMAGTASRLEFVTVLPVAASPGGVPAPRVDAALEADARHRLVLRWRPHVGGQRLLPAPPVSEEVLLAGVDRVTFGFLSAAQGWTDSWRGTELPLLVRVHVAFPAGDRRSWPDLVAAPQRQRPDQ